MLCHTFDSSFDATNIKIESKHKDLFIEMRGSFMLEKFPLLIQNELHKSNSNALKLDQISLFRFSFHLYLCGVHWNDKRDYVTNKHKTISSNLISIYD